MPKFYPVFLDLKDKKCIVIGGGKVAERKVTSLIKAKASVTLISPDLTEPLKQMVKVKKIKYIKSHYEKSAYKEINFKSAFLVIGATDDSDINRLIFKMVNKGNRLVNIVDSPNECNFIVPSTVQQGDLIISISTGGKSPALAKKIRKQLEAQFGVAYKDFLLLMGELRTKVLAQFPDEKYRNKIFQALVDSELLDFFRKGLQLKAESKAEEIIKSFSKNKG